MCSINSKDVIFAPKRRCEQLMKDACGLKQVALQVPHGIVIDINGDGAAYVKEIIPGQSAAASPEIQVGMYVVNIGRTATRDLSLREIDVTINLQQASAGFLTLELGVPVHLVLAPRDFFPSTSPAAPNAPKAESHASPIYVEQAPSAPGPSMGPTRTAQPSLALAEDNSISMICDTMGASIIYTIDGSTPSFQKDVTSSGSSYFYGSLKPHLNTKRAQRLVVCAIARKSGLADSEMARGEYIVEQCKPCVVTTQAPHPARLSPYDFVEVVIDCPADGAQISYEMFQMPTDELQKFMENADVDYLYEAGKVYNPSYPPVVRVQEGKSVCVVAYAIKDMATPSEMTFLPLTFDETAEPPSITADSQMKDLRFDLQYTSDSSVYYHVHSKTFDVESFASIAVKSIMKNARIVGPADEDDNNASFPSTLASEEHDAFPAFGSAKKASRSSIVRIQAAFVNESESVFAGAFDSIKLPLPSDPVHGYAELSKAYPSTIASFATCIDSNKNTYSPYRLHVPSSGPVRAQTNESGITVFRAIARCVGKVPSVVVASSVRTTKCLPLSFSPLTGEELQKSVTRMVTITSPTKGAKIFYTVNGSDPHGDSDAIKEMIVGLDTFEYEKPFQLRLSKNPVVVKAFCSIAGSLDSEMCEMKYIRPPPQKRVEIMPVLSGDTFMGQKGLQISSGKQLKATLNTLGLADKVGEIKTDWKEAAKSNDEKASETRKKETLRAKRLMLNKKLAGSMHLSSGPPGLLLDTVFDWLWEEATTDIQQWNTFVSRSWKRHKTHGDGPYISFVKELGSLEQYDPAKRPKGPERFKRKLVGTTDPAPYGITQTKAATQKRKKDEQRRKKLLEVNKKITSFARGRKDLYFYENYFKATPLNVVFEELEMVTKDVTWLIQKLQPDEYGTFRLNAFADVFTKAQAQYLAFASSESQVFLIKKTVEVPLVEIIKQLHPSKQDEPVETELPAPAKTWKSGRRGSSHLNVDVQNELAANSKFKYQVKQFHGDDEVILSNTDVKATQSLIAGRLNMQIAQKMGQPAPKEDTPAPSLNSLPATNAGAFSFSFDTSANDTDTSPRAVLPTGLLAGIQQRKGDDGADSATGPVQARAPSTSRQSTDSARNSMLQPNAGFGAELKATLTSRNNSIKGSAARKEAEVTPADSVTRGGIVLPKLAKIDHTQFASEAERIADGVDEDATKTRVEAMNFSFNFNDPAPAKKDPAPAEKEPEPAKAADTVTRGGIVLPKLAQIDHTQFASEAERIADGVDEEATKARVESMNFSFNFNDPAPAKRDPAPAKKESEPTNVEAEINQPADGTYDNIVEGSVIQTAADVLTTTGPKEEVDEEMAKIQAEIAALNAAADDGSNVEDEAKEKAEAEAEAKENAEADAKAKVAAEAKEKEEAEAKAKAEADAKENEEAAATATTITPTEAVEDNEEDDVNNMLSGGDSSDSAYGPVGDNKSVAPTRFDVVLKKPLGLSIADTEGGIGVEVTKVKPGSASAAAGNIEPGMRIVAVNGASLEEKGKAEVVKLIKAGGEELTITFATSEDVLASAVERAMLNVPDNFTAHASQVAVDEGDEDRVPIDRLETLERQKKGKSSGLQGNDRRSRRSNAKMKKQEGEKQRAAELAEKLLSGELSGDDVRASIIGAASDDGASVSEPVEPDTPAAPAEPDTPASPAEPDTDTPATPAEPDTPAAPAETYEGVGRLKLVKFCRDRELDYKAVAKDVDALKGLLIADDASKAGASAVTTAQADTETPSAPVDDNKASSADADTDLVTVTLTKPLGMSIAGDAAAGIRVTKVKENSSAAATGVVEAGMRIMAMGGESVVGKDKLEIVQLIKAVTTDIEITFQKPEASTDAENGAPVVPVAPITPVSPVTETSEPANELGAKKLSDKGKKTSGKGKKKSGKGEKTSGEGKKVSKADVGKRVQVDGYE